MLRKVRSISAFALAAFLLSLALGMIPARVASAGSSAGHVIINQFYGANYAYSPLSGRERAVRNAPVSHSFVELYNPTGEDVDLTGWSLQYADARNEWRKLDLEGVIPAGCSFLIRARATDLAKDGRLTVIQEGDMEWDARFNSKGGKIVLLSNSSLISGDVANPSDSGGGPVGGYVDMLGAAGNDEGVNDTIDGYETNFRAGQSKQKSLRRVGFKDTDNNAEDFALVDYRSPAAVEWAKPRRVSDGAWEAAGLRR